MAQVMLSNPDRKRLVALIAERGGVLTPLGRENLLEDAGLSAFAGRLNFDADALTFCQQLVRLLSDYGTLAETGRPALAWLLAAMAEKVQGRAEDRVFVEGLLAQLQTDEPGGIGTAAADGGPARAAGCGLCTVLFLAANPRETSALRLGEEVRTVDERLRESSLRDRFDLRQAHALRWSDLSRLLLDHEPVVVHFAGHGDAGGELLFEDQAGGSQPVPVDVLGDLFRILNDNIRCVVLNACWSEAQATEINRHVDFVIGMSRAIGDPAAIRFAGGFYRGLGFGRSVQTAFDLGCNELKMAGTGGPARDSIPRTDPAAPPGPIPRLLVRPGADAAATVLVARPS